MDGFLTPIMINGKETHYSIGCTGTVRNNITGKFLKPFVHGNYLAVNLRPEPNVQIQVLLHRLVAEGFIPNPENKPTVNHKDGDGFNNRVDNLEWATQSEQNYHAYMTGLRGISENHANSTHLNIDAKAVCELLESGLTVYEIVDTYGYDRSFVDKIHRREAWREISNSYTFKKPDITFRYNPNFPPDKKEIIYNIYRENPNTISSEALKVVGLDNTKSNRSIVRKIRDRVISK